MTTEDIYSDTSMLSDEDRELVAKARALHQRMLDTPPGQRSKLAPEKQQFAVGDKGDGRLDVVGYFGDLSAVQLDRIRKLMEDDV